MLQAVVISDATTSPDPTTAPSDVVRGALLEAGCTSVVRAGSLEQGLALVAKQRPAVVVLDLVEPPTFQGYRNILARLRGVPLLAIVADSRMESAFDAGPRTSSAATAGKSSSRCSRTPTPPARASSPSASAPRSKRCRSRIGARHAATSSPSASDSRPRCRSRRPATMRWSPPPTPRSSSRRPRDATAPAATPPALPARRRLASHPFRRFPPVIADPWFACRIPQFLATTRSDLLVARAACGAGGVDRIRATARRLRGSAIDHGIQTIAELAGALERATRGDDRAAIQRAIDELEQYVEHVQVTYRRPLERKLGQVG